MPGLGQVDAARVAHEQRGVQLAFERPYGCRQPGLPDRELPRRAGEVPCLGDGDEVLELAQFHDSEAYLLGLSRFSCWTTKSLRGESGRMEYTHLGRTGLTVSRLCLGTMNFGPHTTEADSYAIMDAAHGHGMNFFDTA